MKEIWKIIKAILGWIIGIGSVLAGITSFFDTYGIMPKIFGGILLLVGLYIIPKIYNSLNLGIKIKHIVITYLVGLIGLALTIDNKPPKPIDKNTFYITAKTLNIRKGEGKQYDVLYKLNKGDKISVIEKGESWSKISSSQGDGFASNKYISNTNPKDSGEDNILTYIIIGAIVLYGVFSKSGSSNSGGSSKPRSTPPSRPTSSPKSAPKPTPKPTPQKPKHICKHCGFENTSLHTLTTFSCSNSPTRKHQPFEGGIQSKYICKDCGFENSSMHTLTTFSCSNSPTGKHRPFEGGIQPKYYCKHCGFENSSMHTLTTFSCSKSPSGKHQPLI
jgi:hypothetical protein